MRLDGMHMGRPEPGFGWGSWAAGYQTDTYRECLKTAKSLHKMYRDAGCCYYDGVVEAAANAGRDRCPEEMIAEMQRIFERYRFRAEVEFAFSYQPPNPPFFRGVPYR